YFRPPAWIYLILGILSFVIKLLLDWLMPADQYPILAGLILPYSGTFPVIPWISLFFLGMSAYRAKVMESVAWLGLAITIFLALDALGYPLDYRGKFDMTPGYFLLCCILWFASYTL